MKTQFRRLFPLLIVASVIFASGCGGKTTKPEEGTNETAAPTITEDQLGNSDQGKAMGMQTVHFPYDSFNLDSQAKETLTKNAAILKEKGSVKIQIEGHCDQRGGIQYNIALGEKRANTTKAFLVEQGINAERISTISFGKEHPLDPAENDEAYAKNRRANFVVVAQ